MSIEIATVTPPAAPAQATTPPPAAPVQATAVPAQAVETPLGTPTESAAPGITPPAPAVDPRAEINTLATEFGFDPAQFAGFPDANAARAAVRLFAEQTAQQGMAAYGQSLAPAPQQPAVIPSPVMPVAGDVKALDLKALGLEDDEPAAKAIRALEAQFAERNKQIGDIAQRFETMERTSAQTRQQQLHAEAATVVDGFKDARFGAGAQRTAAQKLSVGKLYDLADAIAIGAVQSGQHIPTLSARLARARLLLDVDAIASAAPPAPAAAATALPQSGPAAPPAVTKMQMTDKWSQNPELMARVAASR